MRKREHTKKRLSVHGKYWIIICILALILVPVTGCAAIKSKLNDIKGALIGNGYTITTYDNYGTKVDARI